MKNLGTINRDYSAAKCEASATLKRNRAAGYMSENRAVAQYRTDMFVALKHFKTALGK